MEKKFKLEFQNWDYTCGDGCCYEFGVRLSINGEEVTNNYDYYTIIEFIDKFGINPEEIKIEYEDTEMIESDAEDFDFWYNITMKDTTVTVKDDDDILTTILNHYNIDYEIVELEYESNNCYIDDYEYDMEDIGDGIEGLYDEDC